MPVPQGRMTSQINCGHNIKSEKIVFSDNGEISDR